MHGNLASTSRIGRRAPVVLALLVALVAAWSGTTPRPTLARSTIACGDVPAPAAATPALAATPAPAETVPFPEEGGELTVFAAASLTNAFERIAADISTEHPDVTVAFNFAGSQALVTQLIEGAGADVFASADTARMDAAIEAGVIVGEPVPFAGNRLAIVVPEDNPAGIASPADLAGDDVALVLANPDVPAGRYARESLCLMGADPATYGEGFVDAVAANVVSEEEDVRDVLTRVQLGEADAGIVYVSDIAATQGGGITGIEIPAAVNVLATYPIAPVAGGDTDLARAFIAYVLGPDGQATLAEFGFGSPA